MDSTRHSTLDRFRWHQRVTGAAMRSRGYTLPPTAPTAEWSALRHGGHSVCVAQSAMCVNIPLDAFREDDKTLASVLSTLGPLCNNHQCRPEEVPPQPSLVATRQLANMLLHNHTAHAAVGVKRKRDKHDFRRNDMARRTFKMLKHDCEHVCSRDLLTLERCVFLLEELRADAESEAVLAVRLWKVVLDSC